MTALTVFTVLAIAMTFIGGSFPFVIKRFSREGLSRLFSVRAGILLAVAFTEVLPEAWRHNQLLAGWAALAAFGSLFIIGHFAMLDSCPEYLADCDVHYLGWSALLALSAHSFIDGFNLAVAFAAGPRAGYAVGLALALHKIADGFTLTSLFEQSGYSRAVGRFALVAASAATLAGSLASLMGLGGLKPTPLALLLGFAAGSFIHIAAADILPRLHKTQDRVSLIYFGFGLVGMAALRSL